ncbi:flagellar basal body-associated FliL family protein [Clostridium sp. KNHs214]|uniref:flagellar basal body-associated FliL family protein n=1 Tax=Clostridium sp. KNHs214 TaxID=1540257 RepID=UPI000557FF49|nr:flagellar basal body-associated FliL family protein [Clostridium sp. KNHs214]
MKQKEKENGTGKGKKIIIIILFLIVAGGFAFGGYYFANKKASESMAVNTGVSKRAPLVEESFLQLGEFTVNLADENSKNYIKLNIYISFPKKNKKLAKEIEERKSTLRDAVNLELMSKKSTELDVKGVEKLKKDLLDKINSKLYKGEIMNVNFDNIIIQ